MRLSETSIRRPVLATVMSLLLILLGLATRMSALALLAMTMVIQLLVYPDAYPTHGTWAAVLLYLTAYGPGKLSLDQWLLTWQPWHQPRTS